MVARHDHISVFGERFLPLYREAIIYGKNNPKKRPYKPIKKSIECQQFKPFLSKTLGCPRHSALPFLLPHSALNDKGQFVHDLTLRHQGGIDMDRPCRLSKRSNLPTAVNSVAFVHLR